MKAIIAGASGLIGRSLLNELLNNSQFEEVLILVRAFLPVEHPRLKQAKIVYDSLGEYAHLITGDAIFCCLGSTRKKTPNPEDYRKVDYTYPLELAKIARFNHIRQFHLVSAIGADANSFNFYSKIKGEIERDIQQAGLESLHIYRPSLIVGNRAENRPAEKFAAGIMKFVNPFLIGSLKKYRSIEASKVAKTMLNQSLKNLKGTFIYTSDKIQDLA